MYVVASITTILDAYVHVLLTHQQAAFLNPALFLTVFHVHVHCVDECLQLVTMQQLPQFPNSSSNRQLKANFLFLTVSCMCVLEIAAAAPAA